MQMNELIRRQTVIDRIMTDVFPNCILANAFYLHATKAS